MKPFAGRTGKRLFTRHDDDHLMRQLLAFERVRPNVLTLQANVERAGRALACAYGSSAEFDAAVVRAQRAAGIYGPWRIWRLVLVAGCASAVAALLFCLACVS